METIPESAESTESNESAKIGEDLVACRAHVESLESSKNMLEAEIVQLKAEKEERGSIACCREESLIAEITSNVTADVTDSLTAKCEASTSNKIAAAAAAVECPQPSNEEDHTTSDESRNEPDQMIVASDGTSTSQEQVCNCSVEKEMLLSANASIANLTEMLSKTKAAVTTMAQAADRAEAELKVAKQEAEAARQPVLQIILNLTTQLKKHCHLMSLVNLVQISQYPTLRTQKSQAALKKQ